MSGAQCSFYIYLEKDHVLGTLLYTCSRSSLEQTRGLYSWKRKPLSEELNKTQGIYQQAAPETYTMIGDAW